MMNRRDFLSTASVVSIGLGAGSGLQPVGARAQGALIKTSMGPTTVDVSTGHAGHSSLPVALGYWKEEADVMCSASPETRGRAVGLGFKMDFISLGGDPAGLARQGHPDEGGLHACPHADRASLCRSRPASPLPT